MAVETGSRVVDNPEQRRYELWLGATRAGFIDYLSEPGTILLIHTEVYPALEGQGSEDGWSPAPSTTSAPATSNSCPSARSSAPTCAATPSTQT